MLKSTKTSGRKAPSPDELEVYYRGVYFTTVALKSRLARLGLELRPAVREISCYQRMVAGFRAALARPSGSSRPEGCGAIGARAEISATRKTAVAPP